MPTREELKSLQSLPLEHKIIITEMRIREFIAHYGEDGVCVSFSGGKDSTVLLDLVRKQAPNVQAVFFDTGLEYPEIRNFALSTPNTIGIRPNMTFAEVVKKYGYPLFSKEVAHYIYYARSNAKRSAEYTRKKLMQPNEFMNYGKYLECAQKLPFLISDYCCNIMKKSVSKKYHKQARVMPFIATLAEESMLRTTSWIKTSCNNFDSDTPSSRPLSFWTNQDILEYIRRNNLPIAPIYGKIVTVDANGCEYEETLVPCGKLRCTGAQRTGCMFCAFGAGYEHKRNGQSRFELLHQTHPKIYDYVMRGGEWVDNPYYDPNLPEVEPDGWVNWNTKKIWVPSKDGLGMRFVFDEVNKLLPDYIKY